SAGNALKPDSSPPYCSARKTAPIAAGAGCNPQPGSVIGRKEMHTMKNINLAWLLVAALALGVAACDVEQNSQNTTEPQTSTETEQPAADAGVDMQGDGAEVAEPDVTAEDTDAVAPE